MALYHVQKGIPESVVKNLPARVSELRYSFHAQQARFNDRYGQLPEVHEIAADAQIIEVEAYNDQPVKAVYRQSYNEKIDICIVVLLDSKLVKTVWANEKNDTHRTINLSKYN